MAATIKLSQNAEKNLPEIYGKKTPGAERAVECYLYIRRHTLLELRGIFTPEELKGMVDSYNGTLMDAQWMSNKDMAVGHLEDAERFEYISQKWGFDFDKFIQKVKKLTSAQIFFLQEEINRFWNYDSAYKSKEGSGPDLETFVLEFS
jgi:hypothetical protein